ncbi:LOW QUALITY PROTEIN: agamous-like MADS-box protein AGL75 [Raphanus sativus]|uniref:LOW QUALITY PROTEIN: agamous-like MADS-box protein AGL75 n=1 Tax=Raphanus sativus TaxID=3726 RepID=A0A6J0N4S9_RAPSA|nr:LOW QUALITY PROTEIN: agamous-like MADS-box protein AGL75 [Raphanus sativus]
MRPPRCSNSSHSSYSLAATSLNNRLLTIFKKAQELTTLCDIEACVIHYGPDGELRTWPENRDKVRDLALRYIQLDEAKRRKKSLNLYEFLNKNKKTTKMTNNFKKKNAEELKYPISDHYSVDQINQLIQSLELSYSTLQERRRFLAAKKQNESLNPSQLTPLPQESGLTNQELCVYDQNNNNNFQNLCVSAAQESGLHYQLMPYGGGYYDQNMFVGNNYQDPCVSSNTQDYSVFPLELQESLSNYGLNQLMPQELYGLDQNMCMGDTININNNAQDPCLSDDFCFDFQDPYSGFMVGNPSFSQDFNLDMSSSYVDENRLLQASTLPSLYLQPS